MGGQVTPDQSANNIAVLSACRHRAESVALAVGEKTGRETSAFTQPDLAILTGFQTILIDLDTNWESSLELVRAINTQYRHAEIILLGVTESEERVVQLAEAGASGYVTSTTSLQELVTILQSVQKQEFTCPPNITYALFSHLAYLVSCNAPALPQTSITMRERKVLQLLSQNLTNKEIAARLCISEHTAKNHVHHILRKLGIGSRNLVPRSWNLRWPLASTRPADTTSMLG
ncbi:MAG: LuxR C-terminal-related transcriptional regulator [Candidatus Sulfotelmatobacter sp.]